MLANFLTSDSHVNRFDSPVKPDLAMIPSYAVSVFLAQSAIFHVFALSRPPPFHPFFLKHGIPFVLNTEYAAHCEWVPVFLGRI